MRTTLKTFTGTPGTAVHSTVDEQVQLAAEEVLSHVTKPAALVVDRSSVQFATVSPSETSAEASVRISNDGGTPTAALVTNLDGQEAGAFIVTSDGCRAIVLRPAATCATRACPATLSRLSATS